jgi:hypothetical protein
MAWFAKHARFVQSIHTKEVFLEDLKEGLAVAAER